MKSQTDLERDRRLLLVRRRRGFVMKLVRGGHENQLSRLDDFEVWTMCLKVGQTVGRDQVVTILQDLEVLDYLEFKTSHNEMSGRLEIEQIELTPSGLRFMSVGLSNDDVELM
jgi:hypothetical protein